MRCYLFDLDGTVCNIEHRLHYIREPLLREGDLESVTPYGYCPNCGAPGNQRERRPNGDDLCTKGHRYPSASAIPFKPNWDAFYAACVGDKPIAPICDLLADLARGAPIVFSTGRSDVVRAATRAWLASYVPGVRVYNYKLYMRLDGDLRPDYVVKSEMLDQILADGYVPIMAFEDRDQVVKMYRERGITCAQVAEGNF